MTVPEAWGPRIETVLATAGESPLVHRATAPKNNRLESYILPPAGERAVRRAESDLGLTLPACLREVFAEYTAGLFVFWRLDKESNPLGRSLSGGCELGLGTLEELQESWPGEPIAETLHVLPVASGDRIALRLDGEDGEPAPVEYLDHETGERTRLADDFIDFMNRWTRLGLIGPDMFELEPFLSASGLAPELSSARALQRALGLGRLR